MPQIFNSSAILRIKEMMKLAQTMKPQGAYAVLMACFEFMTSFEDAFPKEVTSKDEFPDLTGMSLEELRGYFTFRTAVRRSMPFNASGGYIYLYTFEMIHGFGVDGKKAAFLSLASLLKGCRETDSASKIAKWLIDYYITNAEEFKNDFFTLAEEADILFYYPAIAKQRTVNDLFQSHDGDGKAQKLFEMLLPELARYGIVEESFFYGEEGAVWESYMPFEGILSEGSLSAFRYIRLTSGECYQQLGGQWYRGISAAPIAGAQSYISFIREAAGGAAMPFADRAKLFAGTPFYAFVTDDSFEKILENALKGKSRIQEEEPAEIGELYHAIKAIWSDKNNPASLALQLREQEALYSAKRLPAAKRAAYHAETYLVSEMTLPQFAAYVNFRSKLFPPGHNTKDYLKVYALERIVCGTNFLQTLDDLAELIMLSKRFENVQATLAGWLKDYAIFQAGLEDFPSWAAAKGLERFYPQLFLLSEENCGILDVCLALSSYQLNDMLMSEYASSCSEALKLVFNRLAEAFSGRESFKQILLGDRRDEQYEPFSGAIRPLDIYNGGGKDSLICGDEIYTRHQDRWLKQGWASSAKSTNAVSYILRIADSFLLRAVGVRDASDNVRTILEFPYREIFTEGPGREEATDIICSVLQTFVQTGRFRREEKFNET